MLNCVIAQRAGRVDCHRQGKQQQTHDHRHHNDRSRFQRRKVGRFRSHYCFSIHPKMVTCPFVCCLIACLIIFYVFLACSFLDTLDIRIIPDSGSLSKLKMDKYELPVQEIKTATELDLSGKGLNHLDAIVIAALIKVQTIAQKSLGD